MVTELAAMTTWSMSSTNGLNRRFYTQQRKSEISDDRSRPGDITFERSWPLCPGKTKIALDVTVASPFRQDSRSHSATDATFILQKAREQKFRKYEGKLPLGVGLIPLPVTTFGLWEENAAANLLV